jgi:hypothetical protein
VRGKTEVIEMIGNKDAVRVPTIAIRPAFCSKDP